MERTEAGRDASDATAETDDDVSLVPSQSEQQWLLQRLAGLVETHGHEHLVLAPMIEPTETYFPDRWAGGDASLRRLLRRLLVYADLEGARVEVVVHPDEDVGGPVVPAGLGAAIWFVRRSAEALHFAARSSSLREPDVLVPAAARCVAEAWRAWHGVATSDAVAEQRLTDVTGVYLGFGRLTADASLRHSAVRTGGFALQRKTSRLGVLPPQALSFLLAAQCVARQLPETEIKRIARSLQANQAGFFREALAQLRTAEPSVATVLRLPPAEQWGEGPSLSMLTGSLDDDEGPDVTSEIRRDEDRGVLGMNEGKPVFRVERSKALRLAKMLALPVVLLGLLAGRMQMGVDIEMWKVGVAAAVLGALGLAVGRLLPDSRCSEPKCATPLPPEAEVCPRCAGIVAGVIHHPKERLAAEERWLAAQDASRRETG